MEIFAWAFLGGLVGALLMDITEMYAARIGITSGVNIALIGRWCLGLLRGRFAHADILVSPPAVGEVKAGWAFHFLVGGGGVAIIFPLFFLTTGLAIPDNLVLAGVLFGLITSLLPWLVLLPSFGWGWFGQRAPQGANPLLASTLSHIPYGFGVGAVIALGGMLPAM